MNWQRQNHILLSQAYDYEMQLKKHLQSHEYLLPAPQSLYEIASDLHTVFHTLRQFTEYDLWLMLKNESIRPDDALTRPVFRVLSEIIRTAVQNILQTIRSFPAAGTGVYDTEITLLLTAIAESLPAVPVFLNELEKAFAALNECSCQLNCQAEAETIYTYTKTFSNGRKKKITFKCGNLASSQEEYDIVVCSAAKKSYIPSCRTLIASLIREKGIVLNDLAKKPEMDLRSMNCWLSHELPDCNFHRIACVEMMGYKDFWQPNINERMMSSVFITFKFMLEQAAHWNISVRRVALPILGTGRQKIDHYYVAAPLFKQCVLALENIDQLEEIVFYEMNPEKLQFFVDMIRHMNEYKPSLPPAVFISYSSKQKQIAHDICQVFQQQGIVCWIAPESIPTGSNYLEEIASAINTTRILVLLLTEDAMHSTWVQKELIAACNAGNTILPYQLENIQLTGAFSYLLGNVQIYHAWKQCEQEAFDSFAESVQKCLKSS